MVAGALRFKRGERTFPVGGKSISIKADGGKKKKKKKKRVENELIIIIIALARDRDLLSQRFFFYRGHSLCAALSIADAMYMALESDDWMQIFSSFSFFSSLKLIFSFCFFSCNIGGTK